MAKLLDAGVDVVRFNVKHQSQVREDLDLYQVLLGTVTQLKQWL
jgi:hypothetical protein